VIILQFHQHTRRKRSGEIQTNIPAQSQNPSANPHPPDRVRSRFCCPLSGVFRAVSIQMLLSEERTRWHFLEKNATWPRGFCKEQNRNRCSVTRRIRPASAGISGTITGTFRRILPSPMKALRSSRPPARVTASTVRSSTRVHRSRAARARSASDWSPAEISESKMK